MKKLDLQDAGGVLCINSGIFCCVAETEQQDEVFQTIQGLIIYLGSYYYF